MNILQASRATGVSEDMIRFYEKKGMIKPARNPQNRYREYSDHDLFLIVLIRHYNCIGLSLKEIKELASSKNIPLAIEHLEAAVSSLKEEQKWIAQRLSSAEDLLHSFRILAEEKEFSIIPYEHVYFYSRSSYEQFADLYAYQSAKPALRIRKENVENDSYPLDQGMMFQYQIDTGLDYTFYEKGLIYRTCIHIDPSHLIDRNIILPLIKSMNKNGYRLAGDIFVIQILSSEKDDVISVNAICEKI